MVERPIAEAFARAGEPLLEMEKVPGKRTDLVAQGNQVSGGPTYADLGVKKHRAIRMQQAGLVVSKG